MATLNLDPDDLEKRVEELRNDALFDEGDTVLTPIAEQHYLLAVSALETAMRHFKLAGYWLSRKD